MSNDNDSLIEPTGLSVPLSMVTSVRLVSTFASYLYRRYTEVRPSDTPHLKTLTTGEGLQMASRLEACQFRLTSETQPRYQCNLTLPHN
jgi:hypothetical protein